MYSKTSAGSTKTPRGHQRNTHQRNPGMVASTSKPSHVICHSCGEQGHYHKKCVRAPKQRNARYTFTCGPETEQQIINGINVTARTRTLREKIQNSKIRETSEPEPFELRDSGIRDRDQDRGPCPVSCILSLSPWLLSAVCSAGLNKRGKWCQLHNTLSHSNAECHAQPTCRRASSRGGAAGRVPFSCSPSDRSFHSDTGQGGMK